MSDEKTAAGHKSSAISHMPSAIGKLRQLFPKLGPEDRDGLGEGRPFYLIMLAVLVAMYIQTLYATPGMRVPAILIPFTGIMLIHIVLHWYSFYLTMRPQLSLPYLILQGVLAFTLVAISGNIGLSFGLYFALIGEAVGIVRDRRVTVIAVVIYLGLTLYHLIPQVGWGGISAGALTVVPITVFIITYVVMYQRQLEARYRIQSLLSELEVAHRQLAEYAVRIEDLTLAAERQRMARELHDTLAQGLAGLILQLEAAASHLADHNTARTAAILDQAMLRARQTLAEARRAIDDLRSERPALGDLSAAIHHEARRFTQATGIPCSVEIDVLDGLPAKTCEHITRIIAEGLTNVALHARAGAATISARRHDGRIELELKDDGIGFDARPDAGQKGHYGLIGMRERARLIGGKLNVESSPGKGTIIRLSI
ncbi:MAG: sensor histidine kinase [Anaerolineae bacterium]|nr:sensor histidine kinase [Anaerolineae bacterium]